MAKAIQFMQSKILNWRAVGSRCATGEYALGSQTYSHKFMSHTGSIRICSCSLCEYVA